MPRISIRKQSQLLYDRLWVNKTNGKTKKTPTHLEVRLPIQWYQEEEESMLHPQLHPEDFLPCRFLEPDHEL